MRPDAAWPDEPGGYPLRVPFYICPNCKRRFVDSDGLDGLTHQPVGCTNCGFGFLFELLEDYYPRPTTGFVVCDREGRIIAVGRGVLELTGWGERDLLGKHLEDGLELVSPNGDDPAAIVLEWGVRKLDQELTLRTRSGRTAPVLVDFFPAYDDDGGMLVALAPRQ